MKRLWIGMTFAIVMVAASWIGNVWYFKAQQLEKPLFLEHYVEVVQESDDTIELYYLQNLHEDKQISTVHIPEYPEIRMESHTSNYKRFTHQQLGRIILSVPMNGTHSTPDNVSGPSMIRTVSVMYDDGSSEEVDIGEIRLISGGSVQAQLHSPFKATSSGGGIGVGYDTGYKGFRIVRPTQLQQVESFYLSLVDHGQLELYLDYAKREKKSGMVHSALKSGDVDMLGTPIQELVFPVQMKRSEYFRISYRYPYDKEGSNRVYRLRVRLGMVDQKGAHWTETMFINLEPYLTEERIRNLVRDRRESNE